MSKTVSRIFPLLSVLVFLLIPLAASAQENACLRNVAIYDTPGTYTFTVPADVTSLRVFAVGAGGGGGAGSGGWGSGGGGGCGGGIAGDTMDVTPGQKVSLYVGYGGAGGNGAVNPTIGGCPWCGTFSANSNGSSGGNSGIGSVIASGGGWGRSGYQNLYGQYAGGSGGGSGGGGGGNGWPGFQAVVGSGGTAGGETNSHGAGGWCTGGGWSIDPGQFITKVSWSAGEGGQEPAVQSYYGGGGGGGVVINNSPVKGSNAPGACSWGCPGTGGAGYGGGGGGQGLDYQGAGGAGAPGVVYIEWDGSEINSCALSCKITFDQNPLRSDSTTIRWSSSNASLFYIKGIGYVSSSGSARVYGGGNYSGTVVGIRASASCPAILEDERQCTTDEVRCSTDGNLRNACGRVTSCRYGCSTATHACNVTCTRTPVCDAEGARVVNACDGTTIRDCASGSKICRAGACIPPSATFEAFDADWDGAAFTATGHLQAKPALTRAGQAVRVYWNVKYAAACTVSGDNDDSWTGASSGRSGKTTSVLTQRTTYTLACTGLDGSTLNESAEVNMVPSFNEQ